MRKTKIIAPKIPTVTVSHELLNLLRTELRKTQTETQRLKWEMKCLGDKLKTNKGKQAELSRLMNRFEQALAKD